MNTMTLTDSAIGTVTVELVVGSTLYQVVRRDRGAVTRTVPMSHAAAVRVFRALTRGL